MYDKFITQAWSIWGKHPQRSRDASTLPGCMCRPTLKKNKNKGKKQIPAWGHKLHSPPLRSQDGDMRERGRSTLQKEEHKRPDVVATNGKTGARLVAPSRLRSVLTNLLHGRATIRSTAIKNMRDNSSSLEIDIKTLLFTIKFFKKIKKRKKKKLLCFSSIHRFGPPSSPYSPCKCHSENLTINLEFIFSPLNPRWNDYRWCTRDTRTAWVWKTQLTWWKIKKKIPHKDIL